MGSDALASLQQWHQPKRLLELATLVVLQRGAEDDIDFNVLVRIGKSKHKYNEFVNAQVTMPLIELSSSRNSRATATRAGYSFSNTKIR